jgi:WD40 repeat protein
MVPQRRVQELLEQAKAYQRLSCPYHTHDVPISLYRNHVCDKTAFPRNNTRVLTGHEDEVWVVEFCHDGKYLASGGQDKTVIIWRMQVRKGFSRVSLQAGVN